MKIIKLLAGVLVVLSLTLGLASCGGSGTAATPAGSGTVTGSGA